MYVYINEIFSFLLYPPPSPFFFPGRFELESVQEPPLFEILLRTAQCFLQKDSELEG